MNDLNWLLLLIAFLAGVIFTLAWSLRAVTRKVATERAAAEPDVRVPEPEPEPEPVAAGAGAAAAVRDSAGESEPSIPAPAEAEATSGGALSADHGEVISWWDRAFVANRPEPATSPTESESGGERSYGSTANRDLLGPAGERIKGNRDSMLYHTIASPYYGRTVAEEWFATEAAAEAAGFTRWDRRKATAAGAAEVVAPAPSKPVAAAAPARNGSTRNGKATQATIKGNRGSMLYHTVESPYYGRTKAEEWFTTEADAAAAGYRRWDHKRTQRG
jgi:hypothetical protein